MRDISVSGERVRERVRERERERKMVNVCEREFVQLQSNKYTDDPFQLEVYIQLASVAAVNHKNCKSQSPSSQVGRISEGKILTQYSEKDLKQPDKSPMFKQQFEFKLPLNVGLISPLTQIRQRRHLCFRAEHSVEFQPKFKFLFDVGRRHDGSFEKVNQQSNYWSETTEWDLTTVVSKTYGHLC